MRVSALPSLALPAAIVAAAYAAPSASASAAAAAAGTTPPASTSAAAGTSAAAKHCAAVSYTAPGTRDEAHAALNELTAQGISCRAAQSVALSFLSHGKPPHGWHARVKTLVVHVRGEANTVSEEILTRGAERIIGDIAN
jgi:hypothetical protein